MILYPTETVYGLGVPVFDIGALEDLYMLKRRPEQKSVSWLVRNIDDIERYAECGSVAKKIAERFLPGPLTLVLPLRKEILYKNSFLVETVGFRISSDVIAEKLVRDFMLEHHMPLTCTSANVSGMPTEPTPQEILLQFGARALQIDTVIDDGPRTGVPTTVVSVIDDTVQIIREGPITKDLIFGRV